MATPYQNVAKAALMNWNGLSEAEATQKIQTESVQELEGQVYAMGSMKYAVAGIAEQAKLSEEEALSFAKAVINGPEDAPIFGTVAEKAKGFTEQQQLGVLSTIHDGWVKDNSSEKKFNKKVERQQLRQYAPLELIGWNEVKSDLLFLGPILDSIHVNLNEEALADAYHKNVASYMENHKIDSQDSLETLIASGHEYYKALPASLEVSLAPMIPAVATQMVENWNEKDPQTAQLFQSRQKVKGPGLK